MSDRTADSVQMTEVSLLCEIAYIIPGGLHTINKILKSFNELCNEYDLDDYKDEYTTKISEPYRCSISNFPSEWFILLQRFQSHIITNKKYDKSAPEDPFDDDIYLNMLSKEANYHLFSHSTDGYYLPVEWEGGPLFDTSNNLIGGWVGSTQQLLTELIELSPYLDITMSPIDKKGLIPRANGFDINKKCIKMLENIDINKDPLGKEKKVWFVLYEHCLKSMDYKSAIVLRSI